MTFYQIADYKISLFRKGADQYTKASYPIRYGVFHEVKTERYCYHFNLNGEIKQIQGLQDDWPHPSDWLKRSVTNDWIYYSSRGYDGVFHLFGEYYLPCFTYATNAIIGGDPFKNESVQQAIASYDGLIDGIGGRLASGKGGGGPAIKAFHQDIARHTPKTLWLKAREIHRVIGGRVTVLPPDARHVDYDVIPLMISDGCLYNCGFCRIKSGIEFAIRPDKAILDQIEALKEIYGQDIANYNSIFLGQHDALHAGADVIMFAVSKAYEAFNFKNSHMKGPGLFMFGSAESLINADEVLFERLNRLPFTTYINIGLESFDQTTLDYIKKPMTAQKVGEAFDRMLRINRTYPNIEMTVNFVMGSDLPEGHLPNMIENINQRLERRYSKGTVYLSPIYASGEPHQWIHRINQLKIDVRLPLFLYLIQRL